MLPVIETVMRGADPRHRAIVDLRPCFGWQYHDLDEDMRPLPTTCPRDGTGPDERRMCEVRPYCQQAWNEATAMRVKTEAVHAELVKTSRTYDRIHHPRRAYLWAGRRSDEIIHALNLRLGLPPVLYDREWHMRSRTAAAWARKNLGPFFAVAPSSYHKYISLIPGQGTDYFQVAKAWTSAAHIIRVDLGPELADAVQRKASLRELLDATPPSKNIHASYAGARYRVFLRDRKAALALGELMIERLGLDFSELAKCGARWRGETREA